MSHGAFSGPLLSYRSHSRGIDAAVRRVLISGRYVLGREVSALEREFATFLSAPRAVGVASGTDALLIALKACGVRQGDLVATVSLTSVATVAAIEQVGASPLLIDVDPETLTMDVAKLRAALKGRLRVKVVIPVHLYGNPANMPAIMRLAHRHAFRVIEDCAQSHGASIDGRMTGTWGDAGAFSFYPTKNLGGVGDGGAIVARDPLICERARRLREYGWVRRYISEETGWNARLDEIQAAVLRVKLRHLKQENSRRRRIAAAYDRALSELPLLLPISHAGSVPVYHQYVVRISQRDKLRLFLRRSGVETGIHYPVPIHLQPAYRGRLRVGPGGLDVTERACRQVLSLPIHAHLPLQHALRAARAIMRWYERR